MNEQMTQQASVRTWTEAPASLNVRFVVGGFDAQLTLRADTGGELLKKLTALMQALQEIDAQPSSYRAQLANSNGNGNGHSEPEAEEVDPSYCLIHKCEMRRFEKHGRAWYSHNVDGQWCKGRPAQNGNGTRA